jgi:hypothetical protein
LKKRRLYIDRLLSAVLLLVFSIALTPWTAFHHHEEVNPHSVKEEFCTHKLHISSHTDTCLVCAAHFEKNYVNVTATFQVFLSVSLWIKELHVFANAYIPLFKTHLRGPPSAIV